MGLLRKLKVAWGFLPFQSIFKDPPFLITPAKPWPAPPSLTPLPLGIEKDQETPCPKRDDKIHCNCWYDGKPCCACGYDGGEISQ